MGSHYAEALGGGQQMSPSVLAGSHSSPEEARTLIPALPSMIWILLQQPPEKSSCPSSSFRWQGLGWFLSLGSAEDRTQGSGHRAHFTRKLHP